MTMLPEEQAKADKERWFAIETEAEWLRAKLGLRTWDEQLAWAKAELEKCRAEMGRSFDFENRRSGRTTRACLWAIATCVVEKKDSIKVDDRLPRGALYNTRHCVGDLIRRLGLEISLVPYGARRHGAVFLSDHFHG